MKLINEVINRRLELMKDLDLNHEDLKAIWHFYEIYQISLNVLGINDPEIKKKRQLIKSLVLNRNSFVIINKLKEYISIDSTVVQEAILVTEEGDEIEEIMEDFYPESFFGISIHDRSK